MARRYDLFLSYNSRDRDTVVKIHEALKALDLKPWFDREALTPGRLWQEEAEKGLDSCRAAAVFVGPNGLGPWENMEMRALLSRVAREGLPLIPVPLPGAPEKLELPAFLSELTWVDLRRGITDEGIAELVRGIPKGRRPPRRPPGPAPVGETPVPPPPALTPEISASPRPGELLRLLGKVEARCREILETSAPPGRRIALELEECPGAVESPSAAWPARARAAPSIYSGEEILELFQDRESELLILGDTGSGKTTTLLLLAQGLAARARRASRGPVPVLLHLSSWSRLSLVERRLSFGHWLAKEIAATYHTGKRAPRSWLEGDCILPLLDGLEEVEAECRAACVDSINAWLVGQGLPGLAVCCGTQAREDARRLQLAAALALRSLSPRQIDHYVAAAASGETLRTVLAADSDLRELAKNPQLLDLMQKLCEDDGGKALTDSAGAPLEVRATQLFDRYVDLKLAPGSRPSRYTSERTLRILIWLARRMKERGSPQFQLEQLQPSWLPEGAGVWFYFLVTRALAGGLLLLPLALIWSWWRLLAAGLEAGALAGFLDAGLEPRRGAGAGLREGLSRTLLHALVTGLPLYLGIPPGYEERLYGPLLALLFGLFFGVRSARRDAGSDIQAAEALTWSWRSFRSGAIKGAIGGALLGLVPGIVHVLGRAFGSREAPLGSALLLIVLAFLPPGVIVGGFLGGLQAQPVPGKSLPNQGMRLTLRSAAVQFFAVSLPLSLFIAALLLGIQSLGEDVDLWLAPALGSMVGLWVALGFSGLDVLQHCVLRSLLFLRGLAPARLVRFLSYAADRGLLLRAGGSYGFRYGPMREALASRPDGTPLDEPREITA